MRHGRTPGARRFLLSGVRQTCLGAAGVRRLPRVDLPRLRHARGTYRRSRHRLTEPRASASGFPLRCPGRYPTRPPSSVTTVLFKSRPIAEIPDSPWRRPAFPPCPVARRPASNRSKPHGSNRLRALRGRLLNEGAISYKVFTDVELVLYAAPVCTAFSTDRLKNEIPHYPATAEGAGALCGIM